MFTGIIECMARVEGLMQTKGNITFTFSSPISHELKIDQSVCHNGVCLTVIQVDQGKHTVTAIQETLSKTNLGDLKIGDMVNIERCMPANGRFDGHIVQGHVDTTATCEKIEDANGSWIFSFSHPTETGFITVEKGSICINGTSLTVVNSQPGHFSVAIIPYTFDHTVFKYLQPGSKVNLEFDIIGKYVMKMMNKAL